MPRFARGAPAHAPRGSARYTRGSALRYAARYGAARDEQRSAQMRAATRRCAAATVQRGAAMLARVDVIDIYCRFSLPAALYARSDVASAALYAAIIAAPNAARRCRYAKIPRYFSAQREPRERGNAEAAKRRGMRARSAAKERCATTLPR